MYVYALFYMVVSFYLIYGWVMEISEKRHKGGIFDDFLRDFFDE
jgi:hypothetical protein